MLDRMLLASASEEKLYSEDVFSTYLYTGSGGSVTVNNGIDLSTKGGLVWIKNRTASATSHMLVDTVRGGSFTLSSNTTYDQGNQGAFGLTFTSTGFSLPNSFPDLNTSGNNYTSWTFRKAPKFFDVVTWTGTGSARTIAHNLGVAPGCIIVKRTDVAADWQVYHRSNANTEYMVLNTTAAKATGTTRWNSTTPTATEFTVGTDTTVNASGGTYVAYLFAHDPTADGIIQCGSFTDAGTGITKVTLPWEPQWVLVKDTNVGTYTNAWHMFDNMRGMANNGTTSYPAQVLFADKSNAEATTPFGLTPHADGFTFANGSIGKSYIYIAIRRGPMKTPTVGTSVFSPNVSAAAAGTTITTNFPIDTQIIGLRGGGYAPNQQTTADRLRGVSSTTADNLTMLATASTNGESSYTNIAASRGWNNTGFQTTATYGGSSSVYWNFRRAPGFFDVVCYTGNGSTDYREIQHNLKVPAELAIIKRRSSAADWAVGYWDSASGTKFLLLNSTAADTYPNATNGGVFPYWGENTFATYGLGQSTVNNVNASGSTYVAYLFASCPGVSKVGSYTGNGSSQTINCGFSNGARFFLVKRTNTTGSWWVYDSARGIVAAADSALQLNSTAAEITSADAVDTDSTGIVVNQEATCNINVNGATYIFLAVS